MTVDEREQRAYDLALSCHRCELPTDAILDPKTRKWKTYCECGKTDEHDAKRIFDEVQELIKTIPAKKK